MKLAVKATKVREDKRSQTERQRNPEKRSQIWTETESGPDGDQQPSQARQDPEMEADPTSSSRNSNAA